MQLLSDKDKVRRVLVTAPIESTMPENGPVLFLGEWCKKINKNYNLIDFEMSDDIFKQVKNNNVKYLDELHNRILTSLALKLNEKHKVNNSVLFWRRLIGKWLENFIHSQHFHWNLIKHIEAYYLIEKTYVIRDFERLLQCKNNMINEDINLWLHASFAYIIKNYTNIRCEYIDYKVSKKSKKISLSRKNKYLIYLSKIVYKLKLIRNRDILFLNTSVGFFNQLKIELFCKQFPTSWLNNAYQSIEIDDNPQNQHMRNWSISFDSNSDFERFLQDILVCRLPKDALENFEAIGSAIQTIPFQINPKSIVIGDWPKSRSVLLRFIIETLEKSVNTKLTLLQHGGNYGIDKYHVEKYYLSIVDIFLSWGWGEKLSQVIPMFYHKKYYQASRRAINGRLTLVSLDIAPMFVTYDSFSPSQYKKFLLNDLDQFFRNIDRSILKRLWLRGFKNHSGIYDYYLEKYPKIHIDNSCGVKNSVKNAIDLSKLFVITYNSTMVQEVMLSKVPVILFWDPELFPIDEEYKYCFDQMSAAGLYHDCPKSAALHINSIWDNVDAWWNKDVTIYARKLFCEKFARAPAEFKKLADTLAN
jgi:putative transferase (TIGR04331 family)